MKRHLSTVAVIIPLLFSLCSDSQGRSRWQEQPRELPFAGQLQHAIEQVVRASARDLPIGISAAVRVRGYELWTGTSGSSQPGVRITADMLFDVGSIAKMFMAALVLKMQMADELSLEARISSWLPPLANVSGNITIQQLLNHTSGIFNVFEHPDFPWVHPDIDYSKQWGLKEVFDTYVLQPYGRPGAVQHYSSTNYLLINTIAEEVGGAPVSVQVQEQFLNALGLAHSFMSMGEPPPEEFTLAHPWADVDQDGRLDDLSDIPYTWIATLTHPALRTTARDLALWMEALFLDRTVLDEESMQHMLTYPVVEIQESTGERYGLGVVDFTEQLGVRAVGHGGTTMGYSAAALYLPGHEAVVVWLLNTGESPADFAQSIMWDTWSRLYGVLSAELAR